MKSIIYTICLLFVSLSFAIAQNCNEKRYDELVKGGNIALDSGKFVEAIQYYNSAKDYCKNKSKEVDKLVLEVVQKIEAQKKQTEEALKKANKLINAFYFAYDRFALAFKDNKFYFIDKNGDKVEKLGEWDKAEQFNSSGWAKVKREQVEFLLDTLGKYYSFTESPGGREQIMFLKNRKLTKIMPSSLEIITLQMRKISESRHLSDKIKIQLSKTVNDLINSENKPLLHNKINKPLLHNKIKDQIEDLSSYIEKKAPNDKNISRISGVLLQEKVDITLQKLQLLLQSQILIEPEQQFNWNLFDILFNKFHSYLISQKKTEDDIQILVLADNQLTSLLALQADLHHITFLDMSNNFLNDIKGIEPMDALQFIDLSNNPSLNWEKSIEILSKLPSKILFTLDYKEKKEGILWTKIDKKQLLAVLEKSKAEQIGELKNLTTLNLEDNQLATLPIQLWELKSLTSLNLRLNNLKNLSIHISGLKNLTTLNLGNNQLVALTPQIGELKNLTTLDLRSNQINILPDEMRELKNLRYLDLRDNPIPKEEQEKIRKLLPNCKIEF